MAEYAESAIESRGPVNRPEIQHDAIGNEGSQVDEACAKLDGAIDRLSHQWETLSERLAPVRMEETPSDSLHDVSPEPVRSRVATFITSRAEQVTGLADRIAHCRDMIDL